MSLNKNLPSTPESTPKHLTPALVRCVDDPLPPHGVTESFRTLAKEQFAEHGRLYEAEREAYAELTALEDAIRERGRVTDEDGRHYTRGIIRYEPGEFEQLQTAKSKCEMASAALNDFIDNCSEAIPENAPQLPVPADLPVNPPTPLPEAIPANKDISYVAEILPDGAPAVLSKVEASKPAPIVVQSLPQESIPKWKPLDGVKRVMSGLPVRTIGDRLYMFDGRCFRYVTEHEAVQRIADICRDMYEDIGRTSFLHGVVEGLLAESSLALKAEEEEQSHYVTFKNRTIDLRTGVDYYNSPSFDTMYCLSCDYTPGNCATPRFDQFLRSITGGDPVLQQRIWQAIGCTIVSDMKVKKIILLQGVPNSGKSVLVNLVLKLFDEGDVTSITIDRFAGRFARATLIDAYMCTIPDMPEGRIKSETVSYLKQFSGGDLVNSDVKNRDPVNFHCKARIWAATNNRFLVSGNDTAMLDRIVVIPFAYAPAEGQRDTQLLDELLKERDAIATRALFAYFDLVRANYCFAGDYKLNAVVQDSAVDNESLGYCVDEFMRKSIEIVGINEAEPLPVEIMLSEFVKAYPIHSNLDKTMFTKAVNDWLETTDILKGKNIKERHGRKRSKLVSTDNPVSVFLGFKLRV